MTQPRPSMSIKAAFINWKINSGYQMRHDYLIKQRSVSFNIIASILSKNLLIIKKIGFLHVKDHSDHQTKLYEAKSFKQTSNYTNGSR